jgi:hypothetical protein
MQSYAKSESQIENRHRKNYQCFDEIVYFVLPDCEKCHIIAH